MKPWTLQAMPSRYESGFKTNLNKIRFYGFYVNSYTKSEISEGFQKPEFLFKVRIFERFWKSEFLYKIRMSRKSGISESLENWNSYTKSGFPRISECRKILKAGISLHNPDFQDFFLKGLENPDFREFRYFHFPEALKNRQNSNFETGWIFDSNLMISIAKVLGVVIPHSPDFFQMQINRAELNI